MSVMSNDSVSKIVVVDSNNSELDELFGFVAEEKIEIKNEEKQLESKIEKKELESKIEEQEPKIEFNENLLLEINKNIIGIGNNIKKLDSRVSKLEGVLNKFNTDEFVNNLSKIEETFKKFEKLTYLETVVSSIDESNRNYNEKIQLIDDKITKIQINAEFATNIRVLLDIQSKIARELSEVMSQVSFMMIELTTLAGYLVPFNNEKDGDDMFHNFVVDLNKKSREIGLEQESAENEE